MILLQIKILRDNGAGKYISNFTIMIIIILEIMILFKRMAMICTTP